MDKINPILIPRNHIIAEIISEAVDKNDFSKFHQYLKLLESPFTESKEFSNYYLPPTEKQIVPNTFCGT
jgi:serine/tyrosine/threonine adenylyltransferase